MCVPHLYCSVHYADLVVSPTSTPCWLAINTPGICCYPTVPNIGKVIKIIIAESHNQNTYIMLFYSPDRTSPEGRDAALLHVPGGV